MTARARANSAAERLRALGEPRALAFAQRGDALGRDVAEGGRGGAHGPHATRGWWCG